MLRFLQRQNTKNAIKALMNETRLMTDCIEKMTLQQRMTKLEKELNDTNSAVQELLELEKTSDEIIFRKYQYKRWDEVPKIIKNYLAKRYGFEVINHLGRCEYRGHKLLVTTDSHPYIGQAFDTYKSIKEDA